MCFTITYLIAKCMAMVNRSGKWFKINLFVCMFARKRGLLIVVCRHFSVVGRVNKLTSMFENWNFDYRQSFCHIVANS